MYKRKIVVIVLTVLIFTGSYAFSEDLIGDPTGMLTESHILSQDLPQSKGLQIGSEDARVHAGLKTSLFYDDNIYLTRNDEVQDWVTVVQPMIGIDVPFGDNRFVADYKFLAYFYHTNTNENHQDHEARGLVELNFTEYKVTIEDEYRRFTNRSDIENTNRIQQQWNNFRTGLSTQRDRKLGFDIGYSNVIDDYLTTDVISENLTYKDRDRMFHIIDMKILYKVAPKTVLIVETDIGWINYQSKLSSDSFYVEPLVGVKGKITNKISADLLAGFRHQSYKSSDFVIDTGYDSFVARGGVDFQVTKDDLVKLGVERSSFESTYSNINHYDATFVELSYTHNFGKKLKITPYVSYQYNWYPEETVEDGVTGRRIDHYYDGGILVQCVMTDWMSLDAEYIHKGRSSSFSKFDFKDNRFIFGVTIGF